MPRTLRVDAVTTSSGIVSIGVTSTLGALPDSPSKNAILFRSKAELLAAVQNFENGMSDEQLLLLLIAIAYKADNTMTMATLNSMIGKTVALSLTSGGQLVKVTG